MSLKSAEIVARGMYCLIRNTVANNHRRKLDGEKNKDGTIIKSNALFEYNAKRLRKESGRVSLRKSFLIDLKYYLEKTGEISVDLYDNPKDGILMRCRPFFVAIFGKDSVVHLMNLPSMKIGNRALTTNETISVFYALKIVSHESGFNALSLVNTVGNVNHILDRYQKSIR